MERIVGDFETRGRLDLGRAGPWAYAEDPQSDVVCLGLWVQGQVRMWIPPWVRDILSGIMSEILLPQVWMTDRELAELAGNMAGFEAHNVEFERAIWHHIMHRRYGFPDLVLEKCHCTAARAAIQSLPRKLEKVGQILGLTQQKDAEGHRAMLRVCKPRAPRKDEKEAFPDWENRIFWEESVEYLSTVIKYCAQDIRTEVDLSDHLQDISPNERKIWLIDQKINQRGFFCDAVGAQAMLEMVAEEKRLLEQEFRRDISGDAWNPNQTAKLREWLASRGVPVDDVAKGTMTETLEEMDLPDDVRRAIEIRLDFSKTSTAKYQALLRRRSLDGRVRSTTLYHGAGTGRWSGKAFQPHNLPSRNLTPQSELCIDLVTACPDPRAVRTLFGSPMKAASSCIRPMLMAPPGMDLLWADYNAVEGRALAWLAGEEHVLRAYREKQDLYKVAAGHAFGVDPLSIDKEDPRRQIGKVIELACGYQGWVGAYEAMAKTYGMKPLPEEQTKDLLLAWRESRPATTRLWRELESAAISAVKNPGQICRYRMVQMLFHGDYLRVRLPSGRLLWYYHPVVKLSQTPWGQEKDMLWYMGEDSMTKQWRLISMYGGKWAENCTQSVCRDLMAEAILRAEAQCYWVVMHVHDEIITEIPEGWGDLAHFENLMSVLPDWAPGLPITAKGFRAKRYQKK